MHKLNRLRAGNYRWPFDPYLRRINSSGLPARKPPIIELVNIPVLAISAIFGIGLLPYGLIEPSEVVRIGNLKRFNVTLRNLMVHMIESEPRSGCTDPPSGTISA